MIELTLALAREMLALAGQPDADVEAHLAGGKAMDTWRAMISAQGGDPDAALPAPRESQQVVADRDGVLVAQHALPFGIAASAGVKIETTSGQITGLPARLWHPLVRRRRA